MTYVTRFAPSPTGPLHLGHALSAAIGYVRAAEHGGRFLLRIEDIDRQRSKPAWEKLIFEDLRWLGLDWPEPVMRQSDRMPAYRAALDRLIGMGLCYPCRCRRSDIQAALSAPQEGAPVAGPDGLVYPGTCRGRSMAEAGPGDVIRLDMARALDALPARPRFDETAAPHAGRIGWSAPALLSGIGDVVLARRDMGTSYHLSVVIDDAAQNITEIVRGADLFDATHIHVILQALLDLPQPAYHHHHLIRDAKGRRLAKRDDARAIASYRDSGLSPADIWDMIGLFPPV